MAESDEGGLGLDVYNGVRTLKGRERATFVKGVIEMFEAEYEEARGDVRIKGSLERLHREMPGIIARRFAQLQEIEATLEHLHIEKARILRGHHKKIVETYNRSMTSTDAWKYAETEEEVVDMSELINSFALVRNKWLAIVKGLKSKEYQLGSISRLRVAGLEEVMLN